MRISPAPRNLVTAVAVAKHFSGGDLKSIFCSSCNLHSCLQYLLADLKAVVQATIEKVPLSLNNYATVLRNITMMIKTIFYWELVVRGSQLRVFLFFMFVEILCCWSSNNFVSLFTSFCKSYFFKHLGWCRILSSHEDLLPFEKLCWGLGERWTKLQTDLNQSQVRPCTMHRLSWRRRGSWAGICMLATNRKSDLKRDLMRIRVGFISICTVFNLPTAAYRLELLFGAKLANFSNLRSFAGRRIRSC